MESSSIVIAVGDSFDGCGSLRTDSIYSTNNSNMSREGACGNRSNMNTDVEIFSRTLSSSPPPTSLLPLKFQQPSKMPLATLDDSYPVIIKLSSKINSEDISFSIVGKLSRNEFGLWCSIGSASMWSTAVTCWNFYRCAWTGAGGLSSFCPRLSCLAFTFSIFG